MNAKKLRRSVSNLLITLVFALVYFYVSLPALNLQDNELYSFLFSIAAVYVILTVVRGGLLSSIDPPQTQADISSSIMQLWRDVRRNCAIPVMICLALAAVYLVGSLISSPIFRARAYRDLLTVTPGNFTAEVDEISFNQIPMLDEDSAMRLGNRKLGEMAELGLVSQFEVADDYTQINYEGRPVRVTPLVYGDIIKWFNNRNEGLPSYLVIDMVTQNVEVVQISDILPEYSGMRYSTAEHFSRYLDRHLRFNYPTYMFDPANFEINDDGVPYWVCPRVVKRIGLFGGRDIEGAVLVNAITGESQYYLPEEIPSWVDRVYTPNLIMQQYDYHGMYQNGFINSILGQRDVTVTTTGYNYIAADDDVHMYTGITSTGTDASNIGFILTNQRTKETKFYSISGATELSAEASAEGAVQHLGYRSTFPLLLNISSQPTYFMALKDAAGLVKMYAMVNVSQYQIVATGDTVALCNADYVDTLSKNNLAPDISIGANRFTGVVEELRDAVIGGNTQIYLRFAGDTHFYTVSAAESELAVVIKPGDRVSLDSVLAEGMIRPAHALTLES